MDNKSSIFYLKNMFLVYFLAGRRIWRNHVFSRLLADCRKVDGGDSESPKFEVSP